MNDTVFIDFNGLPGSGKTTISRIVKAELEKKGYPAVFLKDEIVALSKKKYLMPVLILKEMFDGGAIIIRGYARLFLSLGGKKAEGFRQTFAALKNCMLVRKIKRTCKEPFVISDQCIVQNLLSSVYDHSAFDKEAIAGIISECTRQLDPIVFVNITADVDTAYSRMKNRERSFGRLDRLSGDTLCAALSAQDVLIEKIRECEENAITVDSSSFSAEKCADYVVSEVLKRYGEETE